MNPSITTEPAETASLIIEINRAHREGWLDLKAKDNLVIFYLGRLLEWDHTPTLAELLESYESAHSPQTGD